MFKSKKDVSLKSTMVARGTMRLADAAADGIEVGAFAIKAGSTGAKAIARDYLRKA